jgi:hypothetical protein
LTTSNPTRRPAPRGKAGRTPRRAAASQTSFIDRNRRGLILGAAAIVIVAVAAIAFLSLSRPAYACQQFFDPTPAPSFTTPPTGAPGSTDSPGATPFLGYVQPDMGHLHVLPGSTVRYTYCPPASGKHYEAPNGPIKAGVYGPAEATVPGAWIHNLEHGALVLLYKCPGEGCTDGGQAALKSLYGKWPASPVCNIPRGTTTPVFTRFDDMPWPYAAVVWDVVLPLQSLDEAQILGFYAEQGEQYNPEKQCAAPTDPPDTSTPAPSASPGSSAAPSTSASDSPASSGEPSASPAPAGS